MILNLVPSQHDKLVKVGADSPRNTTRLLTGSGTYNAFLWKHRVGNPGGKTELFVKVSPGKFALKRPLKYGLDV